METLFPYQVEGARWLSGMDQALLADEMGLGKSAQAITAADAIGAANILVICPASVRINWEREFARFSTRAREVCVIGSAKDRVPRQGVVICSYDLMVPLAHEFKSRQWDVLILDEAHYLKERTAKRTKAVYGRGARYPGIERSAARVWRLTGTPAPNNASELWTHLKSAGVVSDPYWDFTFRYCAGFESNYGYKITGIKNVDELKGLLAKCMLRRKKEDVMTELPPIRWQEVTVARSQVELDPHFFEQIQGKRLTVDQFYDDLKTADQTLRNSLTAVSGSGTPNEDRLGILSSMAPSLVTLRRFIGLAKLPACLDVIEEELKEGRIDKIVLFAVHQSVIESARVRLAKYGAVTLYGGTPLAKRQKNIDRFMNDKTCRVFIGNVVAAGTGITLTAAHEVAFLEQDWVPANNAQASMRCHRIGQTKPVRVRVFSLHQSVDEQVQQTLLRKSRELTKIL